MTYNTPDAATHAAQEHYTQLLQEKALVEATCETQRRLCNKAIAKGWTQAAIRKMEDFHSNMDTAMQLETELRAHEMNRTIQ